MSVSKWIHDQGSQGKYAVDINKVEKISEELRSSLLKYSMIPDIIDDFSRRYDIIKTTLMESLGMIIVGMVAKKENIDGLNKILSNTLCNYQLPSINDDIDCLDTSLNSFGDQHEIIFVTDVGSTLANVIFTPNYFLLFLAEESNYARDRAKDAISKSLEQVIPFFGTLTSIFDAASNMSDLAYGEFSPVAKFQLKSLVEDNKCFYLPYRKITNIDKGQTGNYFTLTISSLLFSDLSRTIAFKTDEDSSKWCKHFYYKACFHSACHGNLAWLNPL